MMDDREMSIANGDSIQFLFTNELFWESQQTLSKGNIECYFATRFSFDRVAIR
jgi:hypothetical protein